jgi:hypothetical protein
VSGGGSCHPKRTFQGAVEACEVQFTANAHDPDGDRLTYAWSGCASGTEKVATCTIDAIREFTATVKVKDGQGGSDTASGTAQGVNQPPRVRFGGARPPDPAPSHSVYTIVGAQPTDPEDDADPNSLCGHASVTYSGPCWAKLFLCGGVADGFDVDIKTLAGPGTCVLEARVEDPWGAVGTDRIVFQVRHP